MCVASNLSPWRALLRSDQDIEGGPDEGTAGTWVGTRDRGCWGGVSKEGCLNSVSAENREFRNWERGWDGVVGRHPLQQWRSLFTIAGAAGVMLH